MSQAEIDEFEQARRQASRAQWTLNAMVLLSAVAASLFLFYVLYQVRPFGSKRTAEVEIPTSPLSATVVVLQGDAGGMGVELRDYDEAAGYSTRLSDAARTSLGISEAGTLFRLRVSNPGSQALEVRAPGLTLRTAGGGAIGARWLADVASPEAASPTGRLILAQAVAEYTLAPGESRQLIVFAPGEPLAASGLTGGEFTADGLKVALSRDEVRVATQ